MQQSDRIDDDNGLSVVARRDWSPIVANADRAATVGLDRDVRQILVGGAVSVIKAERDMSRRCVMVVVVVVRRRGVVQISPRHVERVSRLQPNSSNRSLPLEGK